MKYQTLENQYLVQSYIRRGLTIVKGDGVYLYDANGNKYIDFMTGIGVSILGHNNKTLNKALIAQSKSLINLHASLANDQRALVAKKLVEMTPANLKRVYFSNSGSEAVEAAIKYSFLATKRTKYVAVKGSFHGKTLGSLSLMGNPEYRDKFKPLISSRVEFVDFNNIKALKKAVDKKTAALFLEPIQGEAGIIPATKEFLKAARQICDKFGVVLVIDEIQSGMGRTGKFLACQHFGVYPDILCLAKGLAGGIPMGATLVSEKIHTKIPRKAHTTTFGGNPLACACCLTVLNLLKKSFQDRVTKNGNYFLKQLKAVKSDKIKVVRGFGLMIGVELTEPMTPVVKKMQQLGVLAIPTKDKAIRFLPPLTVKKQDIDKVVGVFIKCVGS